jgi:hypothetical protein
MTLIGRINNTYIESFLRIQPKFLDLDYLKPELMNSLTSINEKLNVKESSEKLNEIGITTLNTLRLFTVRMLHLLFKYFISFWFLYVAIGLRAMDCLRKY